MIPFVAGVLSGMAIQKALDDTGESPPEFEPVAMREVTEEHVKETLAKASKTLQNDDGLEQISAREVSNDELPKYIRDKLATDD